MQLVAAVVFAYWFQHEKNAEVVLPIKFWLSMSVFDIITINRHVLSTAQSRLSWYMYIFGVIHLAYNLGFVVKYLHDNYKMNVHDNRALWRMSAHAVVTRMTFMTAESYRKPVLDTNQPFFHSIYH